MRAGLVAFVAASFAVGASACAFSLADVVASDAGSDGAIGSDGSANDGSSGDGGGDAAGGDDGGGTFTTLAQACAPGTAVTSLAVTAANLFATCGTSSGGAGNLGSLVVGPRAGGTLAVAPGAGVGEALASVSGNATYHGSCGLARQSGSGEVALGPLLPASLAYATDVGAAYYFAAVTRPAASNGVLFFDQPGAACASDAGCASDLGCTQSAGPTNGATMGVASFDASLYVASCESGTFTLRPYPLGGTAPSLPAAVFSDAASTCDPKIPSGVAAIGTDLYFGDGKLVKRGHLVGAAKNFKVDDIASESGKVAFLTQDGSDVFWAVGTRVRHGTTAAQTAAVADSPVTALVGVQGAAYFGTANGAIDRTP